MGTIDSTVIYGKTDRGISEVVARTHGLSPTARRVLILVDGKRPIAQLMTFTREGDLQGALLELESLELIHRVDESTEPMHTPTSSSEYRVLSRVKGELQGMFVQALGARGIVLDARVQDAMSLVVLRRVLRDVIDIAALRIDANAARQLAARARGVVDASPRA